MTDQTPKENFLSLMEQRTSPCPETGLLRIFLGEHLVQIVANVPGQSGSLRVLHHFINNDRLSSEGVRSCLDIFAPLVDEARETPGRHPTIDLLLGLRPDQEPRIQSVQTIPNLLARLLDGEADESEKREAVGLLDRGLIRCAEKIQNVRIGDEGVQCTAEGTWVTQAYAVAAMNAGFSAFPMQKMGNHFFDKVPLKTEGWTQSDFERSGVRFIPGCFVRYGAYVGAGTAIMPGGIVNIGAYVAGNGVMVDGGARVATGAQVGKGVELGAGSGIEGILEPAGRLPSIVEDNVRIGANCEVSGIVEEGAVIASGVVMASGKKIFDLRTNTLLEPRYMAVGNSFFEIPIIPRNRVAVSGVYLKNAELGIDCIVLLEKEAGETSLAQLPRNAALYIRH